MQLTRRQILGAGAATLVGSAWHSGEAAVVGEKPSTGDGKITSQMRLSIAAYSFNKLLPRGENKGSMTLHDLCDLAAVWRLDAVEPTSYYFESEDKAYIHSLKAKAFKLGLDISGTSVGNNFCLPPGEQRNEQIAYVKRWVDHSVELGAPCIRIFAGRPHKDTPRDEAFGWFIECLKECCDYAGSRAIFLAIENHGYLTETAEAVNHICNTVNHDWLGINLDTGNFHGDTYRNIELVMPKTITVQVKLYVRGEDGKPAGEADFPRIIGILRKANYRGYVALEYEGKEDPLTGVPEALKKLAAALRG
ncbi:MAG: sugar phosphate isomerase/epimerase [Phycisphaerae bacterium]|nr:sugar phosphate isomerase/epimerase [Phycisphaerae bacterium]